MTKQEQIVELERMLAVAHNQRKQGYKLRLPRYFISEVNRQIFQFNKQLIELKEIA